MPSRTEDGKSKKKKRSKHERRERRAARSGAGFFVAAATVLAACLGLAARAFASARKGGRLLKAAAAQPLHYSEHARCRMGCRHITPAQVRATLARGRVNLLKSDLEERPCPKLVADAILPPGAEAGGSRRGSKHVQVVLSACPRDTTVVTVIDTDVNWECHCPGD